MVSFLHLFLVHLTHRYIYAKPTLVHQIAMCTLPLQPACTYEFYAGTAANETRSKTSKSRPVCLHAPSCFQLTFQGEAHATILKGENEAAMFNSLPSRNERLHAKTSGFPGQMLHGPYIR